MTENKVKKRGWVKNAVIIFLVIMLILTFFSNTIMNRSLPEVAVQYVSSGTLNTKIRGNGTVTPKEVYDVSIDETRKVQSVVAKVGTSVEYGDVLFYLSAGDSQELESAKDALGSLELEYQRAIITASSADYAQQNRDIQLAKEALEEATAERDQYVYSDEDIENAKGVASAAEANLIALQAKVDTAQQNLDALGGLQSGGSGEGTWAQIKSTESAIAQAELDLNTANYLYGDLYAALSTQALADRIADGERYSITVYRAALYTNYSAMAPTDTVNIDGTDYNANELAKAYKSINDCETDLTDLRANLESLYNAYNNEIGGDNSYQFNKLTKELNSARADYAVGEKNLADAKAALTKLETVKDNWAAANNSVKSCQRSLEDLVFSLSQQQKSDNKTQALEALELDRLQTEIAEQKLLIEQLSGGSSASAVTAEVSGVVSSINVSAGHTAGAGQTIATIDVVDRGYTASFSVTTEQSRKVKIGDNADVSSYYWGSKVTATLSAIQNDPSNPSKSKLLVFNLDGDLESGSNVSISIGEKSQNYGVVIPNSAIRSDTNGSFVLIVESKPSPLGNRYAAARIDVNVIASDDTNSAVSGALSTGDCVITSANKPLENGTLIRIAE